MLSEVIFRFNMAVQCVTVQASLLMMITFSNHRTYMSNSDVYLLGHSSDMKETHTQFNVAVLLSILQILNSCLDFRELRDLRCGTG